MYTPPNASSCPDTHWLSTQTDPARTALSSSGITPPSARVSLPASPSVRVGARMAVWYCLGVLCIWG